MTLGLQKLRTMILCATAAALLLIGVLKVCSAQVPDVQIKKAVNPHWEAARCDQCHAIVGGVRQTIAPEKSDGICLSCHNGKSAGAELHPIGRAIAKDHAAPSGWPVIEGRIHCITCHDMKKACSATAARPVDNTAMLRGMGDGEKPFCQNCHGADQFPKFNPHMMLTDKREVIEARCLACHTQTPDRTIKERTGNPLLRSDELLLCKACHRNHKEQFNPGHLGSKIKPEMLAFMRARELIGLAGAPGAELVTQLKNANAQPTMMHPAKGDTISCSTCHNPHQAGLLPMGTSLAYRPMRIVDGRTISPVRGENWCNHCHNLN